MSENKNMKTAITLLAVTIILAGCGIYSSTDKDRELALKEKELALKQKELELKEKEQKEKAPSADDLTPTAAGPEGRKPVKPKPASEIEELIGYWFKPGEATINLRFNSNGRFEFNDYNSRTEQEELLKGEYVLRGNSLTLKYDDRPKQTFRFYKGKDDDPNYYIRKGTYYFVKGDN